MEVRQSLKSDEKGIIELIVNIQQNEFGLDITSNEQPDLSHIEEFYRCGSGNFWVVEYSQEIIASIALLDIGNGNAALRKMFVKETMRGSKFDLAKKLLAVLLDWAKHNEFHSIFLGTVDKFHAAHKFYEKNEFHLLQEKNLPAEFPAVKVDNVFYCREL